MSSDRAAARRITGQGGPAPGRRPQAPSPSPELNVLDRRQLLQRARRRQARALRALSAAVVAAALVVAAAGHALLASDQVRGDTLQSKLATALATQQNEELQRAELESPGRVLAIAEKGLKMVTPAAVTYLAPVDPGPSVAEAHGAPRPASMRASSSGAGSRSARAQHSSP